MPASLPRNLITGGAGFVGSHLVDRLMEALANVDLVRPFAIVHAIAFHGALVSDCAAHVLIAGRLHRDLRSTILSRSLQTIRSSTSFSQMWGNAMFLWGSSARG